MSKVDTSEEVDWWSEEAAEERACTRSLKKM